MEQWLRDNAGFIINVAASIVAAIILGLLAFFGKRLLATVVSFWARMTRPRGTVLQPPVLHFIPIIPDCRIGMTPRDDREPNLQIVTHWTVTNASASGIAAKLLDARLTNPRIRDVVATHLFTRSTDGRINRNDDDSIPPGATRRLAINLTFILPPDRLKKKPMKLKIVVIDQLSNEHKLPPITLEPIMIKVLGK